MRPCLGCRDPCGCCGPRFALYRGPLLDEPVLAVLPGRVVTPRGVVTLTPGLHVQAGQRVLTDRDGRPLGQTPRGDGRRRRREEFPPIVRRRVDFARALPAPQNWPGYVRGSGGNERWVGDSASAMLFDPDSRWQQGAIQIEPGHGYAFVDKPAQNAAFPFGERFGNIQAMLLRNDGGFRVWGNAEHFDTEWSDLGSTPDYLTPQVLTTVIAPPWTEFGEIHEHHVYTHRGPPGSGFATGDAEWGPAGPYFLRYEYELDPDRPNNQFLEPIVFRVSDGEGGMWRYYINRRSNFQGFFWVLHAVHFKADGTIETPGEIVDGEENPSLPGRNRAPNYTSADVLAPEVEPRFTWSGAWDGFYYLSGASLVSVSPDGQTIVIRVRKHRFEDGSEYFPKPDPDETWIYGTVTPTSVTLGGAPGGGSAGGESSSSAGFLAEWTIRRLRQQGDYTTFVELEEGADLSVFHAGCTLSLPEPFVLRGLDYLARTLTIGPPEGTLDPSYAPLAVGQTLRVAVPGGQNGPTYTRELWHTSREERFWDTLAVPTGTLRGALPRAPGGTFDVPNGGPVWEFVMPPEGRVLVPLPIAPIAGYARAVVYAHLSTRRLDGVRDGAAAILFQDGITPRFSPNCIDVPLAKPLAPNVAILMDGTPGVLYAVRIHQLSYQIHRPQGV